VPATLLLRQKLKLYSSLDVGFSINNFLPPWLGVIDTIVIGVAVWQWFSGWCWLSAKKKVGGSEWVREGVHEGEFTQSLILPDSLSLFMHSPFIVIVLLSVNTFTPCNISNCVYIVFGCPNRPLATFPFTGNFIIYWWFPDHDSWLVIKIIFIVSEL